MRLDLPGQVLRQWTTRRFRFRRGLGRFARTILDPVSSAQRLALVANLLAEVPVALSAAPVSRSWVRTASVAAGSAAASDARSHSPAAATADVWQSVPCVQPTAALAGLLDLTYSDPEVSPPTCAAVCHELRLAQHRCAQKSVQNPFTNLHRQLRIPRAFWSPPINAF